MGAVAKQRHTAVMLARLAAIVVMFIFVHDAMMAMSPHSAVQDSHHGLMIELQECGSTEGVARSIPDSPCGNALVTVTPIDLRLSFDWSNFMRMEPIHDGPDSSAIRIWQQVFLN